MQTFNTSPIYIGIFISHSWGYSGHYDKMAEWLFTERWENQGRQVVFTDFSVPKDDPIHFAQTDSELYQAISNKIDMSDIVIIPTGMYSNYSKWIRKEIDAAKYLRKSILAVDLWGQEKKASVVTQAANHSVGWKKQSIGDGIWRLISNE